MYTLFAILIIITCVILILIIMIQNPKGFHICLTNCHNNKVIDQLISDIKETIKDIDLNHKGEKSMCIYGTAQEISDKDIIREVVSEYLYTLNKID